MSDNKDDKGVTFVRIVKNQDLIKAIGIGGGSYELARAAFRRMAKRDSDIPTSIGYASTSILNLLTAQLSVADLHTKGVHPLFSEKDYVDDIFPQNPAFKNMPNFSPKEWWNISLSTQEKYWDKSFLVYPERMEMHDINYGLIMFDNHRVYGFYNHQQIYQAGLALHEAREQLKEGKKQLSDFPDTPARVMTGKEIHECFLPREGKPERIYSLFADEKMAPRPAVKIIPGTYFPSP